ncbi:MAG TPA: TolC family protein [Thermoanaerobacterales bacterium]|nr:TolC family protein [Thermoanaerobacterales bacterium]
MKPKLSELEFKVGRVAKRDVLDSEVQAARARAEYNQALRERDIAYMKLKEIIGLDLDAPINLTSDFTFKLGDEEINLEESIKKALKDRIEVIQAEYALKAAEKGFEVAKASYAPNVNIYKEAEYDYQEALLKLEDAKTAVETDVREAYLKMKGAEESISVLEKSVEFARESARLAKLQYQAGFIRSIDVLTVENALKQVEVQKAAVIYGYNLAKAQFYNAIGGRN